MSAHTTQAPAPTHAVRCRLGEKERTAQCAESSDWGGVRSRISSARDSAVNRFIVSSGGCRWPALAYAACGLCDVSVHVASANTMWRVSFPVVCRLGGGGGLCDAALSSRLPPAVSVLPWPGRCWQCCHTHDRRKVRAHSPARESPVVHWEQALQPRSHALRYGFDVRSHQAHGTVPDAISVTPPTRLLPRFQGEACIS